MRHPFDEKYGVETSGLVPGRHLVTGHGHDRYSTAYYGVAPSIFRRVIKRWQAVGPRFALEEYSFIDVGAGMGRAMMLASELPFREVAGVELHAGLAAVAGKNIERWQTLGHARCPIRLVVEDATVFRFPDGPCVLHLFNPFGAPVLRRLLRHAETCFAERTGELDLLYVNHEQEMVVKRQPGWRQLWRGTIPMSLADEAADRRIIQNQPEGEYGSTGDEECSLYRWVG